MREIKDILILLTIIFVIGCSSVSGGASSKDAPATNPAFDNSSDLDFWFVPGDLVLTANPMQEFHVYCDNRNITVCIILEPVRICKPCWMWVE